MLSYNQVAEAIESEGRKIGKLAEEIATLAGDAAEAESDYKIKVASARIRLRDDAASVGLKVTVGEIEDQATVACSDSLRKYLLAAGCLTAARDAMRASQGRLDGLRTLAAGYRNAGG